METESKLQTYSGPKIIFTTEAAHKMWQYVFSVKTEISGYGKVRKDENGNFIVTDIALFEQVVSGVDTQISAASVAKFAYELSKKGESMEDWKLWWHSHNNMGVFWSATDRQAMSLENNHGRDFLLSVVVNFRREVLGCIDLYEPMRVTLDDTVVEMNGETFISKRIQDEVKRKVTSRSTSGQNTFGFGFSRQEFGASSQTKGPQDTRPSKAIHSGWYDANGVYHEVGRAGIQSDNSGEFFGGRVYQEPDEFDQFTATTEDNTQTEDDKYTQLGIGSLDITNEEKDLLYNYFSDAGTPLSNRQKKRAKKLIRKLKI